MKGPFLAGLSHAEFLRRHWQKKPLLARGAFEEFAACVSRDALFALAERSDVESRLVVQNRGEWVVRHGPFSRRALGRLPARSWTLLVQGVDLVHAGAAGLLRTFGFLPYARLDDVMVSYAAPGGGVGPHFDSYDVFLVQGEGQRKWEISNQTDLALVPDAPLKILRRFAPQQAWTLDPGDVLYLPPRVAHHGVAVGECVTYSVGFRAPGAHEIATRFLEFLQDELEVHGEYRDPDLRPTAHPATLPRAMTRHAARLLQSVRWSEDDVAEFMGRYLTEPKPHVIFERPPRMPGAAAFARRIQQKGVHLHPATRMLCNGQQLFINGECFTAGARAAGLLQRLADARALPPGLDADAETREWLYAWFRAGYIGLGLSPFPGPS